MTYILFVPDSLCNKFISYLLLGNPSVNPMVNVQNVSHGEYITGGPKNPAKVHEPYISCFVSDELVSEEAFNHADCICGHKDYVLSHNLLAF